MKTGGRKGEERVPRLDGFSCDDFFAIDGADDKASEVVFTGRIEAGHFRRFATDEGAAGFAAGAAHAVHELFDDVGIHFPEREIIEKEKRLGALDENVVHAVIDEIAADGG